ncbi:hypothetical protein CAPTEDRAFT_197636 [Capitella teleta]|uniref:G-protein coupled receptors family 1 profile domain-containing protein n=1 Tax=Capitella teleta TaxID=283909 RepID=R7U023_CAPTE|nr:hypothetical protein CAPTEDRAFT_197636 [Capitella teleta]|eukprot:ELT99558.1 hypothetical protein CAPTEDRAFT_197636 [Capitella teleta]
MGYIVFNANGFAGRHWFIQGMCKGVYFMYYTSFYCSILTMLAIGFERWFLVICYPLKAVSLTSIGNTKKCTALIWMISVTLASPVFYIIGQDNGESCHVMDTAQTAFTIFAGCNAIVIFSIPAIILIFLYAKILYTLHKSIEATLQMRTTSSGDTMKKASAIDDIRGRKRVMVMLISMLTVFLVTWGPFLVHRFKASFGAPNLILIDRLLHNVFGALSFGSATLNPIMIPVNSSQFRIAIKKAYGLQPRLPKRGTLSTTTSVVVVLCQWLHMLCWLWRSTDPAFESTTRMTYIVKALIRDGLEVKGNKRPELKTCHYFEKIRKEPAVTNHNEFSKNAPKTHREHQTDESEAETGTETEEGAETEIGAEAEAEADTGREIETGTEEGAETEIGVEAEAGTETEEGAETEIGAEAGTETETETGELGAAEAEADTGTEEEAETGTETEERAETEAETETEEEAEA